MTAWGPRTETALGTTPATRCPLLGQPLYVTFYPRTVHSTNLFIHVFIQNTNGRGRRRPLNQSAPRSPAPGVRREFSGGGFLAGRRRGRGGRRDRRRGQSWAWLPGTGWSRGVACNPGFGGPLSSGGSGSGMGSTGVLHVSVLPVFAKGAVAVFVQGRGAQGVSEAGGLHRGGPVGEPGSEGPGSVEGRPHPARPAAAARRPYLAAGSASGARQQPEPRQKPPKMASREALQPR